MSDQHTGEVELTEAVVPTVWGLHDFDQHVPDADDVVHAINPHLPGQGLCGHQWDRAWWQDNWVPDNYPRCPVCHDVRAAVDGALHDRWGTAGTHQAASWMVLDRADPTRAVHHLNPVHLEQSLCGWVWQDVTAEGRGVDGYPCRTCALLVAAGVGRPGSGLRNVKGTTGRQGRQSKRTQRARRAQTDSTGTLDLLARAQEESAQRVREAAEADRASSLGHGVRGKSVRAASTGLPTLGRRR